MPTQFDEQTVHPDPIEQFQRWFEEARPTIPTDPDAAHLVTATSDGRPSSRMVLLKQVDARGFIFFTNYLSRKGRELDENPHAGLSFYWPSLSRQVRIEGTITRTSRQESEDYFATRPRSSQIGAHASAQSQPLGDRQTLEQAFARFEKLFLGTPVPCPPHWGGFVLKPERMEFWQGRESRLHDRLVYERAGADRWTMVRLAP